MKYLLLLLLYIYIFTGVFIAIKIYEHPIAKTIMAIWFGLFWVPILIADFITCKLC